MDDSEISDDNLLFFDCNVFFGKFLLSSDWKLSLQQLCFICKKNSGTTTCEKCEVIVCSAKCLKKHSGFHNSQRNKKLKKKFSFFSCFCAVNSRESNESDENATKSNYKEVKTNQLPNTSTNSASSTNSI